MERPRAAVRRFVERELPGAAIRPLRGDASARRFYRVHPSDGPSRILMEYDAPFRGETDDQRLARIFLDAGLPIAGRLAADGESGCLLLEDLGDTTLEMALAEPNADRRGLIGRAVGLAVDVAERGTPVLDRSDRATAPALDEERFRFEMDFFLEHFVAGLLGLPDSVEELRPELYALARRATASPRPVFCHRDFHSRNLMVRPDGGLAMVDIQDARRGPDSYDLASLLRDAYVDIDETWVDPLVESYRTALSKPPAAEPFRERFDCVSAQRMLKALGTFGYQATVLKAERYLDSVPRTLGRLSRLLPQRPETAALYERLQTAGLL
jgi:aminoglycoside/choline kinase family phosphotransferase